MAALDMTRSPVVTGARRTSLIAFLIAAFQAWNDTRLTRKALSSLSDHELQDIGLTRSDIDSISLR